MLEERLLRAAQDVLVVDELLAGRENTRHGARGDRQFLRGGLIDVRQSRDVDGNLRVDEFPALRYFGVDIRRGLAEYLVARRVEVRQLQRQEFCVLLYPPLGIRGQRKRPIRIERRERSEVREVIDLLRGQRALDHPTPVLILTLDRSDALIGGVLRRLLPLPEYVKSGLELVVLELLDLRVAVLVDRLVGRTPFGRILELAVQRDRGGLGFGVRLRDERLFRGSRDPYPFKHRRLVRIEDDLGPLDLLSCRRFGTVRGLDEIGEVQRGGLGLGRLDRRFRLVDNGLALGRKLHYGRRIEPLAAARGCGARTGLALI